MYRYIVNRYSHLALPYLSISRWLSADFFLSLLCKYVYFLLSHIFSLTLLILNDMVVRQSRSDMISRRTWGSETCVELRRFHKRNYGHALWVSAYDGFCRCAVLVHAPNSVRRRDLVASYWDTVHT